MPMNKTKKRAVAAVEGAMLYLKWSSKYKNKTIAELKEKLMISEEKVNELLVQIETEKISLTAQARLKEELLNWAQIKGREWQEKENDWFVKENIWF